MQTVRTSEELTRGLAQCVVGTIALVPTMGALHAGHLALVDEAKRRADAVVATIFVNPTQFNDRRSGRYPRTEAEDARSWRTQGATCCGCLRSTTFIPMASRQPSASPVCPIGGKARRGPGHFDGVATVVAKLLLSVRPDVALFGEKDFQQLAVIRRMVADLAIGVEIVGVPTVRDADGLALSSRNAFLSRGRANGGGRSAAGARNRARFDFKRGSGCRNAGKIAKIRSGTQVSRGSTISRWSMQQSSSRSKFRGEKCG